MMSAMNRACRVDIVTKPLGILSSEATGLRGSIQAARVVVTSGDDSRSHVVVHLWSVRQTKEANEHGAAEDSRTCGDRLARDFQGAEIVVLAKSPVAGDAAARPSW